MEELGYVSLEGQIGLFILIFNTVIWKTFFQKLFIRNGVFVTIYDRNV